METFKSSHSLLEASDKEWEKPNQCLTQDMKVSCKTAPPEYVSCVTKKLTTQHPVMKILGQATV
jgi:hypothetical protein